MIILLWDLCSPLVKLHTVDPLLKIYDGTYTKIYQSVFKFRPEYKEIKARNVQMFLSLRDFNAS